MHSMCIYKYAHIYIHILTVHVRAHSGLNAYASSRLMRSSVCFCVLLFASELGQRWRARPWKLIGASFVLERKHIVSVVLCFGVNAENTVHAMLFVLGAEHTVNVFRALGAEAQNMFCFLLGVDNAIKARVLISVVVPLCHHTYISLSTRCRSEKHGPGQLWHMQSCLQFG